MRSDNATFAASNLAAARKPRYTVVIDFSNAGTDLVYLTSHRDEDDAHAAGLTEGVDYFPACIQSISGQTQRIDPLKASATIGSLTIKAIDNSLSSLWSTKVAAGKGSRLKRMQVYVGFADMSFVDYELVATMLIQDLEYDRGVYTIRADDIQREARKDIFVLHRFNLRTSISATDTKIYVNTPDTSTYFKTVTHDAAYTDQPSRTVGYVRIENEIIRHTGMASDGGGNYIQVDTTVNGRGALNSVAVAHDVDAGADDDRKTEVMEWVYIEGPGPLIAYNILTGTTYPAHWTLEIDTAYVTQADFEQYADLYDTGSVTAGRQMRFEGVEKQDGKKFIEEEILLWLGCYMPVYANGALGFRKRSRILSASGYSMVLDESNVVKYGALRLSNKEVVNDFAIKWNWSPLLNDGDGKYTKTTRLIDAASIASHGLAEPFDQEFRGVHTGANTDQDIRFAFDALRDSYAGPPLRLSAEALPVANPLEVGDTVRVSLPTVTDPVTGAALDRVMEVQQVGMDWRTGVPKLDLFGSSTAPGALTRTTDATVVADAYYTGSGTELSTVLTISAGAVTANGSLTGGSTMAAGTYYYDGDLTINAGVTVTISDNVFLKIKGSLTINGDIDGAGGGHAGGTGQTTVANNSTAGTAGYFTSAAGGAPSTIRLFGDQSLTVLFTSTEVDDPNVTSGTNEVAFFAVVWDGSTLVGLPTDLRGSSGGGGLAALSGPETGSLAVTANGSAGGAGAAALMILSRGGSFGASGGIDISGGDPGAQNSASGQGGNLLYGGVGGPGMPSALLWMIDGNNAAPDLDETTITALPGTATFNSTAQRIPVTGRLDHGRLSAGLRSYHNPTTAFTNAAHVAAATRLQYINPSETIAQEDAPPVHQIATPSAPSLATYTTEVTTAAGAGDALGWIKVSWTASTDPDADGYQVEAKQNSEAASDYRPVFTTLDETATSGKFQATEGVQYNVRIRVLSTRGKDGHSDFSSAANHTITASNPNIRDHVARAISASGSATVGSITLGGGYVDGVKIGNGSTIGDTASGNPVSVIEVDSNYDIKVGVGARVEATDSYESQGVFWHWNVLTGDFWIQSSGGAGSTSITVSGATATVGAGTTGDSAEIYRPITPGINGSALTWDSDRKFKARFATTLISSSYSNRTIYIGMGRSSGVNDFVGFKITNGALTGCSKSGASESNTSTIKTYSVAADDLLEAVFEAGSQVTYYVNGVSQGTVSTNLPSGVGANATHILSIRQVLTGSGTGTLNAFLGEAVFYQSP